MSNPARLKDARDALGEAEDDLERDISEELEDDVAIALAYVKLALGYLRKAISRRPA